MKSSCFLFRHVHSAVAGLSNAVCLIPLEAPLHYNLDVNNSQQQEETRSETRQIGSTLLSFLCSLPWNLNYSLIVCVPQESHSLQSSSRWKLFHYNQLFHTGETNKMEINSIKLLIHLLLPLLMRTPSPRHEYVCTEYVWIYLHKDERVWDEWTAFEYNNAPPLPNKTSLWSNWKYLHIPSPFPGFIHWGSLWLHTVIVVRRLLWAW